MTTGRSGKGAGRGAFTRAARVASLSVLLMVVMVSLSACGVIGGSKPAPAAPPVLNKPPEIVKPQPVVVAVSAATTGVFEKYYAILDATIKNGGSDGMVLVVGTIAQGTETIKSEVPVYIPRDATLTIRLVFPLKWKGGEWTPSVQTEIP